MENLDELISAALSFIRIMRKNFIRKGHLNSFSIVQFEALYYINEVSQPTMKNIAQFLGITPPSATSIVNALIKMKKIERLNDKKDKRIVKLKLTPLGRKTVADTTKIISLRMKHIFSKLNEKERSALIKIYKKLSSHYE